MRLARKSSSHAATLRLRRSESLPGGGAPALWLTLSPAGCELRLNRLKDKSCAVSWSEPLQWLPVSLLFSRQLRRRPSASVTASTRPTRPRFRGVQKKADFITACRGGTELIPGATPAAAPVAATAPASTPAPASTGFFGRKKVTPATTAANPAPSGANQFAAASQAQAHCPAAVVVWVNTQSSIYHLAGTKNYGNTKQGAYMCEADATAAGDRASKTEKHP